MLPVIQNNLHLFYQGAGQAAGHYYLDGERYLVIIESSGENVCLLVLDEPDGLPPRGGVGSVRLLLSHQSLEGLQNKDLCRMLDTAARQAGKGNP